MARKLSHMLATSGMSGGIEALPFSVRPPRVEPLRRRDELVDTDGQATADLATCGLRRTRIWEFDTSLHCSIIGTCLTTAELRHLLKKLNVAHAETASDHDLHGSAVTLAGRPDTGKFVQKTLDRKHRAAIFRYAKAKDAAAVLELWEDSLKQGDVPGAYWAAMTHHAATKESIRRVFGDVHMLSHLIGAANRADIRRLRQLEQDIAALTAKIERQQRQLQTGFTERDQVIARLNAILATQPGATRGVVEESGGLEGADELIRDLNKRLVREVARRERAEQKVGELSARLAERERALEVKRLECEAAQEENELLERHLSAAARPEADADELGAAIDLSGRTLLYVGGRAHHVPQLKGLIERAGGQMLHHDGGIEHSPTLLPGLLGRADHVVFPVDCISHDATATIKRMCRAMGKSYEPLRTASLASLVSALTRMQEHRHQAAAE